jgi:hypothetical protein
MESPESEIAQAERPARSKGMHHWTPAAQGPRIAFATARTPVPTPCGGGHYLPEIRLEMDQVGRGPVRFWSPP